MDDLISRQVATDALTQYAKFLWEKYNEPCNLAGMIDAVDGVPSADVVEVVRCKDCIHFELDKPYIIQGVPVFGHEVCNAWGNGCKTDQNGFCFMGERRTDG